MLIFMINYIVCLSKFFLCFQMCAEIRCTFEGKVAREFLVDQWPCFSVVIARPGPQNVGVIAAMCTSILFHTL